MSKLLDNIIDFKSVVLKGWLKDLYGSDKIITKEDIFDLCLDAYLRGMSDAIKKETE
jgi:hypothetical protein